MNDTEKLDAVIEELQTIRKLLCEYILAEASTYPNRLGGAWQNGNSPVDAISRSAEELRRQYYGK